MWFEIISQDLFIHSHIIKEKTYYWAKYYVSDPFPGFVQTEMKKLMKLSAPCEACLPMGQGQWKELSKVAIVCHMIMRAIKKNKRGEKENGMFY